MTSRPCRNLLDLSSKSLHFFVTGDKSRFQTRSRRVENAKSPGRESGDGPGLATFGREYRRAMAAWPRGPWDSWFHAIVCQGDAEYGVHGVLKMYWKCIEIKITFEKNIATHDTSVANNYSERNAPLSLAAKRRAKSGSGTLSTLRAASLLKRYI